VDTLAITDVAKETIVVLMKLSLPLLLVALGVGLIISLFQALTQIQEPTLSFVPKMLAIFATLLLIIPYMGGIMNGFVEELFSMIIQLE
jgi:flagellar biosynthetic protein FliQ